MIPLVERLEEAVGALLSHCSNISREPIIPILLTPASLRTERIEGLSGILGDTDASLSRIRAAQKDLKAASRLLAAHRAKVAHPPSPISALPTEILLMVFTSLCPQSCTVEAYAATARVVQALSSTCARWRDIMLSTPQFWSRLVITAGTRPEMMEAYAFRVGKQGLALYTSSKAVNGGHCYLPISSRVSKKISMVALMHPEHISWLRFPAGTKFHSLRLGPSPPNLDSVDSPDYDDPEFTFGHWADYDYRPYTTVKYLTCEGAAISNVGKGVLTFPRLEKLTLKSQDFVRALVTLKELHAPSLKSLVLDDLVDSWDSLDEFPDATATNVLSALKVSGTPWNVKSAAALLKKCARGPVQLLDLQITPPESLMEFDLSIEDLYRIFDFAQATQTISISSIPSVLLLVLEALADSGDKLSSFMSLTISLVRSTAVRGEDSVPSVLGKVKTELERMFRRRSRGGKPQLAQLCISRALLGDNEAAFAACVDLLEVID